MIEPFRVQLAAVLDVDPRMRTIEVLRRMRQAGYAGSKSVLYDMARSLRPRTLSPLSAFDGLPGVLSQHDFGAAVVAYSTGRRERVHFFASRLRYSSYLDVRLVRNDRIDSLTRGLLAGFETFGGVPLVAMFQNSRTVTLAQDGQRIEWDETIGRAAIDYRFALELCPRGNRKECAEDLVGFVKQNFFKVRRFRSHDDVLDQLSDWQHEFNTAGPRHATGVTPRSRLGDERQRLRALAIPPARYALRFSGHVGDGTLAKAANERRRPCIERLEIFDPRAISEVLRVHRPEYPERERTFSGNRSVVGPPSRAAVD